MDSESMNDYHYNHEPVYTEAQMQEVLQAVSDRFGKQVGCNDGTLLVSVGDYNRFRDRIGEI